MRQRFAVNTLYFSLPDIIGADPESAHGPCSSTGKKPPASGHTADIYSSGLWWRWFLLFWQIPPLPLASVQKSSFLHICRILSFSIFSLLAEKPPHDLLILGEKIAAPMLDGHTLAFEIICIFDVQHQKLIDFLIR